MSALPVSRLLRSSALPIVGGPVRQAHNQPACIVGAVSIFYASLMRRKLPAFGISPLVSIPHAAYRVYFGRHGQTVVILLCGVPKNRKQQISRSPRNVGKIGNGDKHEQETEGCGISP